MASVNVDPQVVVQIAGEASKRAEAKYEKAKAAAKAELALKPRDRTWSQFFHGQTPEPIGDLVEEYWVGKNQDQDALFTPAYRFYIKTRTLLENLGRLRAIKNNAERVSMLPDSKINKVYPLSQEDLDLIAKYYPSI